MKLLRMDKVEKRYQDFTLQCSMEVEEGYITGLIGANGAGKSTAFKAVLGLIHIDGGNIEILGKNQRNFTTQDKEGLGVVLAESSFNGMLTIKDAAAVMDAMFHKFKKKRFFDKCSQYGLPVENRLRIFPPGCMQNSSCWPL